MTHEDGNGNLIRLHEQRMDGLEAWCNKLEAKVDKIPWILLLGVFNVLLTLVGIFVKVK